MSPLRSIVRLIAIAVGLLVRPSHALDDDQPALQLARQMQPWLNVLQLQPATFSIDADICESFATCCRSTLYPSQPARTGRTGSGRDAYNCASLI